MSQQIGDVLRSFSLADEFADRLIKTLDGEHEEARQSVEDAKRQAHREIGKVEKKLDRLTGSRMANQPN